MSDLDAIKALVDAAKAISDYERTGGPTYHDWDRYYDALADSVPAAEAALERLERGGKDAAWRESVIAAGEASFTRGYAEAREQAADIADQEARDCGCGARIRERIRAMEPGEGEQ